MNISFLRLVLALTLLCGCSSTPLQDAPEVIADVAAPDDARIDVPGDATPLTDTIIPPEMTWSTVVEDYGPGALLSGWSGGADDLWFVGGEMHKPLVLRYEGDSWSTLDPGTGEQLWWVHGFTGGPVVVVGDRGTIARYDEGAWEQMPTGLTAVTLYGVWGSSPDNMWAVGGPYALADMGQPDPGPDSDPESEPRRDILLHYDGTAWTQVALPELPERSVAAQSFFKVWGTGPDDVFVVGGGRLILHYDGTQWEVQDTGPGSQLLFTVTGRGPDDVWAVGGGATAVLLHYDGETWTEVELPPFSPQVIQGVWTAPGRPVYVSGFNGFLAELSEGQWQVADLFTVHPLHAVLGDDSGGIWAAGGNIMTVSPNYRGTLAVANREVAPFTLTPTPVADVVEDTTQDTSAPLSDLGPTQDSAETDATPGPPGCDEPMSSCPDDHLTIHPGAPCTEGLVCAYNPEGDGSLLWNATCDTGTWNVSVQCDWDGGPCYIPPASEACLEPFDGQLVDGALAMGPVVEGEAFTPFVDGQQVALSWGGQGSPMLLFQLQIDGAEPLPDCYSFNVKALTSAGTESEGAGTFRARCGETLTMYVVLPQSPFDCDQGLFEVTLEVTVPGVGTVSHDLVFQGGDACFG